MVGRGANLPREPIRGKAVCAFYGVRLAAPACFARRAARSARGDPSRAPAKGDGPGLQDPSSRPAARWKEWSDAVDVYAQIEQIFREADRPSSADCDGSIRGQLPFPPHWV